MSREIKLINTTMVYFFGNFGSKFLQILLLPLITRYLTKAEYGYFDLVIVSVSILLPIVTLEISDALLKRLLEAKDENTQAEVITNSLLVVLCGIAISLLAGGIFTLFLKIEYYPYIMMFLITNIVSSFWQTVARGLGHSMVYSLAGIIQTLVIFIFSIVFTIFMNLLLEGLLLSYCLAFAATILFIEFKCGIRRLICFSYRSYASVKKLISFSLPLLPNLLSWWIITSANRFIIGCFLGMDANGIYAVSAKFPAMLVMVSNIFYLAWQESAITEFNSSGKDIFFSKAFNVFMRLMLSIVLIMTPLTKLAMEVIVSPEFIMAEQLIPILYFSTVFNAFSAFYGTGYLGSGDTKFAFTTTLWGAVANVIIIISFINFTGLYAAAIASLVSQLIIWLLRVWKTRKYFRIQIDVVDMLFLGSLFFSTTFLYYTDSKLIQIVVSGINIIASLNINQQIIRKIFILVFGKFQFKRG